jgi:hypothetical protein
MKSTVEKRRVKRRQERVSHKKLRTLRSRKYARKTARKIGGASNQRIEGYGALLYDDIPLLTRYNSPYHLPICVFFIRNMNFVNDHVYIFFNKNVTPDEIRLVVKHYLGIESDDFLIEPSIEQITNASDHIVSSGDGLNYLWEFLGDKFVKLGGCMLNYCLESGVFQPNTPLFNVVTTKHKMTIGGKAVEIKTRSRKEITPLFDRYGKFSKKIPQMRDTIQAKLFKTYIQQLKKDGIIQWDETDLNKQRDNKKRYGDKYLENGAVVYGDDRKLDVTWSDMVYLDKFTPKQIVMNILHGLKEGMWFSIPKDIEFKVDDNKEPVDGETPVTAVV